MGGIQLQKEARLDKVKIRRAIKEDARPIHRCIQPFVKEGRLLPRSLKEINELLGQYYVAECDGQIVGCAVLEIYSRKLCEIRSLAVTAEAQQAGIGKLLVQACIKRARSEKILEVMVVSSNERFFRSCGFDFILPGEKKALFFMP
jgi:amino-acid N-acetyltransferase